MEIIKYIILGILQGITEPLPISSSGHIYIFKAIFNTRIFQNLNLEIFLNFASFIAIVIILRKELKKYIKGIYQYIISKGKEGKDAFHYVMMVLVGTLPVGVLGLIIKDPMEQILSKNIFIVGIGFIITALFLLLTIHCQGEKEDKDITVKDAFLIGLFQVVALLPGISRSGMTLVGCILRGFDNKTSLKYSFMLYLPVSIATMILGISEFSPMLKETGLIFHYILGMIAAGVFTYLSYNWLTKTVERKNLWKFSIYLFAIALFSIMFFI